MTNLRRFSCFSIFFTPGGFEYLFIDLSILHVISRFWWETFFSQIGIPAVWTEVVVVQSTCRRFSRSQTNNRSSAPPLILSPSARRFCRRQAILHAMRFSRLQCRVRRIYGLLRDTPRCCAPCSQPSDWKTRRPGSVTDARMDTIFHAGGRGILPGMG